MKHVILTVLFLISISSHGQSLREIYQQGVAAYEAEDYPELIRLMARIDSIRPNYAPISYNLAAGYALMDQQAQAIDYLRRYLQMDTTQQFEEDPDFDGIRENEQYSELLTLRKSLSEEIPIDTSYLLSLMGSHPESITYSRRLKSYFFGGVRDGGIWKIKQGGNLEVWASSASNSWSVMGLAIDPRQRYLWACTAAMDEYDGILEEEKGQVSILQYDLRKGTLLETFALPPTHVFGDLVINENGDVFVSDGATNQLFWISAASRELVEYSNLSEQVYNLQGLCFNHDQSALFLSDYISGIYKLDLATKELQKVATPTNLIVKGIDGLYYQDGKLIGLHNGTIPNRIIRYRLDDNETAIIDSQIMAQAGVLGEPTQGVFVDGAFCFIANSPWGAYDKEGNFEPAKSTLVIGTLD